MDAMDPWYDTDDKRRFRFAYEKLAAHEGGYSNHPSDYGGETNFGWTLKTWRALVNPKATTMKGITYEMARKATYEHYWPDARNLPGNVGAYVMAFSFHKNITWANKLLQRAIRAVSQEDIKDDGIVGPATRAAMGRCSDRELCIAYRSEQAGYYRRRVAEDPSQNVFLKGWLNRAYS